MIPTIMTDGGITIVTYADPSKRDDPPCPHVPTSKLDALGYLTEWEYDGSCNAVLQRRYSGSWSTPSTLSKAGHTILGGGD